MANVKVKRAAVSTIGMFHTQMGPGFKSLCVSLAKIPSLKELLAKCFEDHPFDATSRDVEKQKRSLAKKPCGLTGSSSNAFEVPKANLSEVLADDFLLRLVRLECKYPINADERLMTFFAELKRRQSFVEKEKRSAR